MVYPLNRTQEIDEGLIGHDIADLLRLYRGGLRIVNTLLISNQAFKHYAEKRILDDRLIEQIVRRLQAGYFSRCKEVYVQVSTPKKCSGLFDKFRVRNNRTSIRYVVEKIYRTWFEEEARTFRIIQRLGEEDTAPAIYIQPCFDQVLSLDTRTPVTGELTNRENHTDDIDNVVDYFHRRDSAFLAKIESIIRRPSLVYFVRGTLNRICRIDDELMTNAAYLNVITEYLKTGLIDQVEYLMRITPPMILNARLVPYSEDDIVAKGLGVSESLSNGILIFRTSNLDKAPTERFVLAIDYASPDDVDLLYRCVGAIGTYGGQTSHLAVFSRGTGIPAVIANDCDVLEDLRVLRTPHRQLEEFTPLIVDGSNGHVAIINTSDTDVSGYRYVVKDDSSQLVKGILRIIASLSEPAVFPQLPVNVQYHIANLKYTMRQARIIE